MDDDLRPEYDLAKLGPGVWGKYYDLAVADTCDVAPTDGAIVMLERGVWVYRTGVPISVDDADVLMEPVRDERDLANLGLGDVE